MAKSAEVVSHWHHRAEEFNTSALEYYAAVRNELEAIEAPVRFDTVEWSESGILSGKRTYLRVEFNRLTFDICAAPFGRSFFFSWWFSVRRPDFATLYGCATMIALPWLLSAAVALTGSWTKGSIIFLIIVVAGWGFLKTKMEGGARGLEDLVIAMPIIGRTYVWLFRPVTYYAVDTRMIFEETVHATVLKVVDGLLAAKGAKALAPEERRSLRKGPQI